MWDQTLKVELVPVPLPLKDQKVLFIKGFEADKDEVKIKEFLNRVFSKLKIDTLVTRIEFNKIFEMFQAVVYFD